mgnify:CR=1 FL=1
MNLKINKILSFLKIKLSDKNEKLLIQIIKFIIVGGIATIIDWIIYYLLYNYVNIKPLYANIISYSISTIYNYLASIKIVFDVKKNDFKRNFIIFVIFSLMGLLLSEMLIYLMIDKLSFNKMISKILSTIIVMIFNFITRKKYLER